MSFLRHGEIYRSDIIPGGGRRDETAAAPRHRCDEFPAGYSLAGCSPAEPASASPDGFRLGGPLLRDNQSSANGLCPLFLSSHSRGPVQSVPCPWKQDPLAFGSPQQKGHEKETTKMFCENRITLIGFLGKDARLASHQRDSPHSVFPRNQRELERQGLRRVQDTDRVASNRSLGEVRRMGRSLKKGPSSKPRANCGTASISPMVPTRKSAPPRSMPSRS